MIPTKAAEILILNVKEASPKMPPDVKTALLMGGDALLRFADNREDGYFINTALLKGETKE